MVKSKTHILYDSIKLGDYVYLIYRDYQKRDGFERLIKFKVTKKDYCIGRGISLYSTREKPYWVDNAINNLFLDENNAASAYVKRLKYARKLCVYTINLHKKIMVNIDQEIKKYSKGSKKE